jgi:nucleotide sugar dehydrogenase
VKITVVALGKIGLPLAVQFARRGHQVTGTDIDRAVVDTVNRGEEPFPGEEGLADKLSAVVADRQLAATTDTTLAVSRSDVVVVVVPLVVDPRGNPDFAAMDAATAAIGKGLRPGTLVSFETTVPVGTTRHRWKPLLERESGLVEGQDFHVVFSPERVLTGRIFADLRRYPKLVGGLSDEGSTRGVAFYGEVLEFDDRPDLAAGNGVWNLGSAETAEMAKLAETTYRDVNIGLANQFARFAGANGIDVHRVIEASNSQPYSHIHRPGIAVGGHCIPVYPRLYLWNDPAATVVRAAREANSGMPAYAVELLQEAYGALTGVRVLVLGATYRGGVKETAFSGAFALVAALEAAGADVAVQDPMFDSAELAALGFVPQELGTPVEIAVIQADHASYSHLQPSDLPGVRLILDGRSFLDSSTFADAQVITIGRGEVECTARDAFGR